MVLNIATSSLLPISSRRLRENFRSMHLKGPAKAYKQDGEFAGPENEPQLMFDEDFDGLDAAVAKFEQIVQDSIVNGFTPFSLMDEMELQARLERMK